MGLLGILVMILLAFAISSNRWAFPWRLVAGGVLLQLAMAVLLLRVPPVVVAFDFIAGVIAKIISFANEGTRFVFGDVLADPAGPNGFIFAVHALPVIIYFAALMAVLYHFGIMQRLVALLAWLLRSTLGVTGTEALVIAANVFVGQTEAPLCVRPLINKMTRSQLMTLMVGGFATIAGSVLAFYVSLLAGVDPTSPESRLFIKHLLTASVLSAPAAFVIAKILVPETERPVDEGLRAWQGEERAANMLDAAARGTTDGLRLALNVGAMLIAFVALLYLVNWPLELIGNWGPIAQWRADHDIPPFSLELILGVLFRPLAWVMGVSWADSGFVGMLLGQKLIVTELYAYVTLGREINSPDPRIDSRSAQIAAYALCGFANFPSIAIQIGGLSALAPQRRADFASLGFRAMLGGALASWMTASVASLFIA